MMNNFIENIKRVFGKYFIEVILLVIAFFLAIASFVLFLNSSVTPTLEKEQFSSQNQTEETKKQRVSAEISGAVVKPGVYEFEFGARLNQLLEVANGLSDKADKQFFSRNFNLAALIQDQQKVYIPTKYEIAQGIFSENQAQTTSVLGVQSEPTKNSGKININTASMKELDSLAGIGEVTAQKIVDGRPYQSINELLERKIVKQSVFDNINNQITAP